MKSILEVFGLATALLWVLLATGAMAQEETVSEGTEQVTDEAPAKVASEEAEGTTEAEQPAAEGADGETGERSADAQAAKAVFDEKFAQWKAAMKEIDTLRVKYQTADETTREQLQKQLQEKFEVARAMIPSVITAAVAAFEAAPDADEEITKFLNAIAFYHVKSDQYEDALPLVQSLVAGGVKHEWLPVLGGLAAFTTGDYETAQEMFAKAKEAGFFDVPPETRDPVAQQFWQLAMRFSETLDAHRQLWEEELVVRAREAEADDLPRVLLKTSAGDITIELFENEAPVAVKNFISLVEARFYDGLTFHRVLENFMAQGGRPDGTGGGGPGYNIPCECDADNARTHFRGTLSMAHAGKDTGGSQFFITFRPTPELDGKHTAFGRVIEGMDVLAKIQRRDPDARPPLPEPEKIIEAKILRKRPDTDYSDFKKLPGR